MRTALALKYGRKERPGLAVPAVPAAAAPGGGHDGVIVDQCRPTAWATSGQAGRLPALMKRAEKLTGIRAQRVTDTFPAIHWDMRVGMVPAIKGGYASSCTSWPETNALALAAGKTTSLVDITFSRADLDPRSRTQADGIILEALIKALRALRAQQCAYRPAPDPRAPKAPPVHRRRRGRRGRPRPRGRDLPDDEGTV